jgi:putative ABC transport system substrate-binding protein
VARSFAAGAQPSGVPVIGSVSPAGSATPANLGFSQGLRDGGYLDGQNVVVEYRWADFRYDRLPELVVDLVARKVNVLVAFSGAAASLAAKAATATMPVVFSIGDDPIKAGLVESLNRPGGNVTGITLLTSELGAKRLQLLCELVSTGDIGVLMNPNEPDSQSEIERVQQAAHSMARQLRIVPATTVNEFPTAFDGLARHRVAALLIGTGGLFGNNPQPLVALAAQHRLPAIYDRRESAQAGGLISYGTSFFEVGRATGRYAARILRGERPADLPVMQPTTFELAINLKTANALGLAVPRTLLARADEVIE